MRKPRAPLVGDDFTESGADADAAVGRSIFLGMAGNGCFIGDLLCLKGRGENPNFRKPKGNSSSR